MGKSHHLWDQETLAEADNSYSNLLRKWQVHTYKLTGITPSPPVGYYFAIF
jgi:hypothetical protein